MRHLRGNQHDLAPKDWIGTKLRMTDPRDARNARQLSDAAMWFIVCHPGLPAPELAVLLGASANTIRNARYRFRREGWCCRVSYVPCAACGEPVTIDGHVRRNRAYHPACRTEARRSIQQGLDQRRWEQADVHERTRLLAKRKAYDEHYQTVTRSTASRHGARWSREDDAVLDERDGEPAYRLAQALGRTLKAVRSRQGKLRQRRGKQEVASA